MPARSQWFSRCIGLTNSVQPYCMFESITVHPTIKASCTHRLIGVSARDGVMFFDSCLFGNIRHCSGDTACAVRHTKEGQPHFHAGECSGQHQLVDAAEVPDTKNPARNLAEPRSQGHIEAVENQRAE